MGVSALVCLHVTFDVTTLRNASLFFFKILFIFREKEAREKERETNIDVLEIH